MSTVFTQITMSLDGFVAGPNIRPEEPLGDGGERLHEWLFGLATWSEMQGEGGGETGPVDDMVRTSQARTGATIMGRRMFHPAEGGWGAEPERGPWGDNPPYHHPVFVLTHHGRPDLPMEGGTTFHFVTDGIESALQRAMAAAGDRDIHVAGGAQAVQQFIAAGLLDELIIHVAPVLMGGGSRLFDQLGDKSVELERVALIDSPAATHIHYRIVK
jgi:dihydrofolate reductase